MSNYPYITEPDLVILGRLKEQQRNQRAIKIRKKVLKETHDKYLAESFAPLTKN